MIRSLSVRRTLAAGAIAPLLAAGLVACGSGGDGSDTTAHDPAIGAALLTGLKTGDDVDPGDFIDTVTDGIEQSTTAHLTMNMSMGAAYAMKADGDVDYTTKPPSMQMSMTIPGAGDSDVVMVDGVMYMKMGDLTGGKYWKLDPSDPDSPLGSMGLDKMLQQSDPASALQAMKSGIKSVTYQGDEDVDGRHLDHYVMTVDIGSIMDSLGADLPSGASGAMPDKVTYDIWLDDENRFAQMQMDLPVMDQTMSMKMTAEDWGTDVSIEAPSSGDVTDMPDFGSMMSPSPNSA